MRLNAFLKNQSNRIIMAQKPIKKLRVSQHTQPTNLPKPMGLWYGFGDSWISWCKSEMPEWIGKYYYTIEVYEQKLLQLKTALDIKEFTTEYKTNSQSSPKWRIGHNVVFEIDWNKVAKKYSGIEINPYQWSCRNSLETMWYNTWDVASGCIWDNDTIKSFREI